MREALCAPAAPRRASFATADALVDGVSPRRLRTLDLDRSVRRTRALSHRSRERPRAFPSSSAAAGFAQMRCSAALTAAARLIRCATAVAARAVFRSCTSRSSAPSRRPRERTAGHSLDDVGGHRDGPGGPSNRSFRTWLDLGSVLSIPDLVAPGDFLLNTGAVSGPALADAVARWSRRRGRGPFEPQSHSWTDARETGPSRICG